jgi:hypothetical protein
VAKLASKSQSTASPFCVKSKNESKRVSSRNKGKRNIPLIVDSLNGLVFLQSANVSNPAIDRLYVVAIYAFYSSRLVHLIGLLGQCPKI